jgi:hypothetical protein
MAHWHLTQQGRLLIMVYELTGNLDSWSKSVSITPLVQVSRFSRYSMCVIFQETLVSSANKTLGAKVPWHLGFSGDLGPSCSDLLGIEFSKVPSCFIFHQTSAPSDQGRIGTKES